MPERCLPWLVAALFFAGMLRATAANDRMVYPSPARHALWHLVGAFGVIALWGFQPVRLQGSTE